MPSNRKAGVLLGPETARRVLKQVGQKAYGNTPEPVNRRSGAGIRYFILLEDFSGNGPAKAKWVSRVSDTSRGTFDVFCRNNILDGAMAGYTGPYGEIDSEWCFIGAECITECESSGSLAVGSPPEGTVGAAYTHSVVGTNIDSGSIAASGLPPGLVIDDTTGEVTGTPTEAGEFLAFVTGTSPKLGGGSCTLTKSMLITVIPAA